MFNAEMAHKDFKAIRNTNIISEVNNEKIVINYNGEVVTKKDPSEMKLLKL